MKLFQPYCAFAAASILFIAGDALAARTKQNILARQVVRVQHFTFTPKFLGWLAASAAVLAALFVFVISASNGGPASTLHAATLGALLYGFQGATNYGLLKHWSPVLAVGEAFYGASALMLVTTAYNYISKNNIIV
jgi:hypothetical protein